jgi:transient receptor potential cation channel subfamily V protein 6
MEDEDPFGLTSALDQMAFAQDIVMIDSDVAKGTTVIEMTSVPPAAAVAQAPPPTATSTTSTAPPDYDTAVSTATTTVEASVTQAHSGGPTPPSTVHSRAPTATTTPARIPEKTFADPLRDLILLSEVILIDDEEEFLRNVKSLADDSSCLDYVLEVRSTESYNQLQQRKQDQMKSSQVEQGIALFQNPKEIVDPVKEAEFLRTLEALEDTDDSDAVEKPVLGKISLVRRAKSAATRTSSDKRKSDENPLYNVAWEEIEVSSLRVWI